ncbi:bHLH domain containing transcription factor, Atonal-related superfamily [Oopsacas minuta]|uniref:BHLH domain containing transcription factor, Atonal-related superfamily n=1 Tax=Oopsacas minuta TaxID=111878 RepID=A0AAV7KLR8_9METZ|nr:bHLH domain containing transcription factor, Atonal-related superfamily [Oopsacas minuta]
MDNSQANNITQTFSPSSSERSLGSPISVESVLRRTTHSNFKHSHKSQIDGLKKIRRMAANARERCRMHTVNYAFDKLRTLVPCYPSDRKLSKIATLKLATMYIADLAALLRETTHTSLMPSDDIKLDCMLSQPPRRYNIHTEQFNRTPLAIKSESCAIGTELELECVPNHRDNPLHNLEHTDMCKVVPVNFDFGDQMATPGWLQNQNNMISPISETYDSLMCKQVSFECNLPKDIQTN